MLTLYHHLERYLVVFLVSIFIVAVAYSQVQVCLSIANYSPQEYNFNPQNWAITQDHRGIMYFGNSNGLLEYDGVSWRTIELPGYSTVRSLNISLSGVVFIGGIGEFGYLDKDKTGTLQYISLIDKLDKQYHNFFDVWFTICIGDDVYFSTEHYLFHYSNGKMVTVKSGEYSLGHCFSINDELYVHSFEKGILKLDKDSLIDIRHGSFFSNIQVWYSFPIEENIYVLGSLGSGLFKFDFSKCDEKGPVNPPSEFITEAEPQFFDHYSYSGCRLHDGRFAVGFIERGITILDPQGKIDTEVHHKSGLRNEMIWYMYQDIEDNLWLATDNGISKIDVSSPVRYWGLNTGIGSSFQDIIRFNGTVYIASFSGIFYFDKNELTEMKNISAECYGFYEFIHPEKPSETMLLACADVEGVCQIEDTTATPVISNVRPWCLHQSKRNLSLLYIGVDYGFMVAQYKNKKWELIGDVKDISDEILYIHEDNQDYIWLTTSTQGFIRLLFSDNHLEPVEIMRFDEANGLLSTNEIGMIIHENRIIAYTKDGLFYFDEQSKRFHPECLFESRFCDGTHSITNLEKGPLGKFWIFGEKDKAKYFYSIVKKQDRYLAQAEPCFYSMPNMEIQTVFIDDQNIVWIGGSEGLYKVDTRERINKPDFNVLLRQVSSKGDTVLCGGSYSLSDESDIRIKTPLNYSLTTILFKYAAPSFINEGVTQYKYKLEGIDADWSDWTESTSKEYSYIPEGDYTFFVKARNIFGIESNTASISFKIDPPWFRSMLAIFTYGLIIAALILLLIRLKSTQLRKANIKLERLVKERTSEVMLKNEEIQAQSDNLQKLNTELKGQNFKIETQRDQLKELNSTKDKFFNIIAHDLKSPFQALIGFSDLLSSQLSEYTLEEIRDISKMINKSAETGFVLLENLLSWAMSQTKRIKYEPDRLNLKELMTTIVASQSNHANNKQISISLTCDNNLCMWADVNMISTIFRNLLANAIKFTDKGGYVLFSAIKNNDHIEITVKDNGKGIPTEIKTNLFNLEKSQTTLGTDNEKGTGLGLVLCKEFVEANKGNIRVESEVGKGSKFTLEFPLCNGNL